MVTKKGRRNMLIRQIREAIYDIGRPATAHEILDHCTHMRNVPTMNQLCGMMRRRGEFIITDSVRVGRTRSDSFYGAHLYWVADTQNIASIRKCKVCGDNMPRQSNESQTCTECYKQMKKKERAEWGKA